MLKNLGIDGLLLLIAFASLASCALERCGF